jgi:HTH-type transcriptional regulator / antitoxin HigA
MARQEIEMSPAEIVTQMEQFRTHPKQSWFIDLQRVLIPLAPITTKAQYDKAMKVAAALASLTNLRSPVAHYLEILARNIELYEQDRFSGEHDPIENLSFLLSENSLSASDLGRLLGHRELGSKILKRQRQLTIDHIRKLANHFHVSPATFI